MIAAACIAVHARVHSTDAETTPIRDRPIARRTPISCVRSRTDIIIVFNTPSDVRMTITEMMTPRTVAMIPMNPAKGSRSSHAWTSRPSSAGVALIAFAIAGASSKSSV